MKIITVIICSIKNKPYLCHILIEPAATDKRHKIMKKLLEYLRLAQFYSDAAKGNVYFIESKSLMNAAKNKSKDMLYLYKTDYILRAAKRACVIGKKAYYDIDNSCIYFEIPNGQVSFHVYDMEEVISSYCTCETHEWSGKEDSRFIINEYFNKERIF